MSLRSFVLAVLLLSNVAKAQQSSQPANPIEKFPKVVAIVEGKTISRDQLADECIKRYGSVVLDNLLNKQLILQACKAKNVTITQKDVNDEIARVANKVGLDTTRFLEAIQRERDITPEQYASEITWPMLALRALAADQIEVKPNEVEQVIQSEYGAKVQVRMIAVSKKKLRMRSTKQHQQLLRLSVGLLKKKARTRPVLLLMVCCRRSVRTTTQTIRSNVLHFSCSPMKSRLRLRWGICTSFCSA